MEGPRAPDWETTVVITREAQSRVVRVTAFREALRGLFASVIWGLPAVIVVATVQPAVAAGVAALVLFVAAGHVRDNVAAARLSFRTGQEIRSTVTGGDWWVRWVSPLEAERRVGLVNYVGVDDEAGVVDLETAIGDRSWWPRELLGDEGLAVVRERIGRPRGMGPLIAGPLCREWVAEPWMVRRGTVLGWVAGPTIPISVVFLVGAVVWGVRAGGLAWMPVLSPVVWWLRDLRRGYRDTAWAWRDGAVIRTSVVGADLVEEGVSMWQSTPLAAWGRPRRIGGMWVLAPRLTHGAANILPADALSPEMVEAIRRASDPR